MVSALALGCDGLGFRLPSPSTFYKGLGRQVILAFNYASEQGPPKVSERKSAAARMHFHLERSFLYSSPFNAALSSSSSRSCQRDYDCSLFWISAAAVRPLYLTGGRPVSLGRVPGEIC